MELLLRSPWFCVLNLLSAAHEAEYRKRDETKLSAPHTNRWGHANSFFLGKKSVQFPNV
ncbi:MAG: hypothetical protein LZF62_480241 [Nitrospira sp.]|nr:MAG: hypothetical protein LZF62_480241 [Nitrospira sp.]